MPASKFSWYRGLKAPKEHVSAEVFSQPLPVGDVVTGPPDRSRYQGVPVKRGFAVRGAEDMASIITLGDKAQHIPYAPIGKQAMVKMDPEKRTDLYLGGTLRSWQIPGRYWPLVRTYRQLALQAEMLDTVPELVDVQMNDLYDTLLGCLREEAA
jgi:hypothetical protein